MLYAAAAVKINSFHDLFHGQERVELHSPEQETSPCHKSVYHQQSEKGCEHKSHITENTKCPLCEFNVTPDQLIEGISALSKTERDQSNAIVWFDTEPASANVILTSRGPPAIV